MAGHTVNTQDDPNKGACGYWSAEKAKYHYIGLSDIYNPNPKRTKTVRTISDFRD